MTKFLRSSNDQNSYLPELSSDPSEMYLLSDNFSSENINNRYDEPLDQSHTHETIRSILERQEI